MEAAIFSCVGTEVLFVHDPFATDHEGHDSGFAVLHRNSQDGKTARHLSVNDVVLRAAFGVSTLGRENSQRVTVNHQRRTRSVRSQRRLRELGEISERAGGLRFAPPANRGRLVGLEC